MLGAAFVGIQTYECGRLLRQLPLEGNIFGGVFYTFIGLHAIHVAAGLILLAYVFVNALRARYTRYHAEGVTVAALYWYFVVVVWVFLYLALYVF